MLSTLCIRALNILSIAVLKSQSDNLSIGLFSLVLVVRIEWQLPRSLYVEPESGLVSQDPDDNLGQVTLSSVSISSSIKWS